MHATHEVTMVVGSIMNAKKGTHDKSPIVLWAGLLMSRHSNTVAGIRNAKGE